MRTEIQQPSGVSTEILNAGEGVFVEPDGATRKLLLNNTLAERAWHIPSLSLLGEADLPKTEVASGRAASENSRDTNVISLSLPTSSDESHVTTFREMTRRDFHIDRQSGLVTKMEHPSSYENGMSGPKVEILYSDYRNISGVMVPFKINTVLDGRLFSEVVLTDVQFNVGLADSDFVLPEVK